MSKPLHPILGDYAFNKFGAAGFAYCHDERARSPREGRIALCARSQTQCDTLTVEDRPPDEVAQRRFHFSAVSFLRIERMLSAFYHERTSDYFVSGPDIGSVQHIIGRQSEDYIGLGSTSQDFENCAGEVSVDKSGIVLEFSGSLSRRGFLEEVVPSLFTPSYSVRCRLTWQASCFFFNSNTLDMLYGKFAAK